MFFSLPLSPSKGPSLVAPEPQYTVPFSPFFDPRRLERVLPSFGSESLPGCWKERKYVPPLSPVCPQRLPDLETWSIFFYVSTPFPFPSMNSLEPLCFAPAFCRADPCVLRTGSYGHMLPSFSSKKRLTGSRFVVVV